MPPDERSRPAGNQAANISATSETSLILRFDSTDLPLRCAWLRHHGRELFSVDPSGSLSAQLFDFADLLEAARERGWL